MNHTTCFSKQLQVCSCSSRQSSLFFFITKSSENVRVPTVKKGLLQLKTCLHVYRMICKAHAVMFAPFVNVCLKKFIVNTLKNKELNYLHCRHSAQ